MNTIQIIGILFGGGIILTLIKIIFKLGKFSQKFDTMSDLLENINEDTEETRGAIIEMQDTFNRLGYPMQRILKTTSPVELTEYGKKLVEESDFKRIFNENREKILGWIKERNPETQYDAQEISRAVLLEHKDDPIFESSKQYAFGHGTSLEQILRAGAIIVRDEIIKELSLEK